MKSGRTLKSSLVILAMALWQPAFSSAASIITTPNFAATNLTPGITLQDTATLSGFSSFPNTLTFTLFFDGGSTPVDTETSTVSGNGEVSTPIGYTLPATGTPIGSYEWFVNFAGTVVGPETVTVNPGAPTITTTANPQTATWNGSPVTLTDQAILEGGYNPGGSLTFTLFFNGGPTPVDTETVSVAGDGTYATPIGFTLPSTGAATGQYEWMTSYSGDGDNHTAHGAGELVFVLPEPSGSYCWELDWHWRAEEPFFHDRRPSRATAVSTGRAGKPRGQAQRPVSFYN